LNQGKRTAVITGAGQNIGRACAIRLARDGFNVVINGRTNTASCEEVAERVREAGGEAHISMGDIGVPADARRIVDDAIKVFGAVDVLINNAAIRPETPFLEMPEDEWHQVMNVNFNSCFWLARAAIPGMVAKEFGPKGITANIISPGPIRPEAGDPAMISHITSQVGRIPTGRLGEASEIAAMVSHLASNEGGFINGQLLQVNGGTET